MAGSPRLLGSLRDLGLHPLPPEPGTPGDPGLFGPGSAVWRIGRERVLLAAGPAALLLQLAHPLIAAAVADHSRFAQDPFERLRATLQAVLAISFGDASQARAAAASVAATHRRVRGVLSHDVGAFGAGAAYDATDPELAMWVHATLVWTALEASALLIRPLPNADRATYYREAKRFARLFGVPDRTMPADYPAFRTYVERMVEGPALTVGPEARSLAGPVLHPPVPAALRPAAAATRELTARLLPGRVRAAYGLSWGPRERARAAAVAASTRGVVCLLPSAVRYWPHYRQAVRRVVRPVSA